MALCMYLTAKRTAELLGGGRSTETALEQLAKDALIKSALLPGTKVTLINLDSLWEYLAQSPVENLATDGAGPPIPVNRQQLVNRIRDLVQDIGHKSIKRQRWVNLVGRSSSNRVFAQLHLPKTSCSGQFAGIFLILPNGGDFDLSAYELFATHASLTELEGDYGPNADWLRGNGVRGTTSPAKILHLPITLLGPDTQDQWNKLTDLLIIAQRRRG